MKKIYLLYIVLISLATTSLIGCSDWTESEAKTFPESIVSDEYYAALRTYKQTDHQVAFGWFGGWSGEGAYMKSSLAGIPDNKTHGKTSSFNLLAKLQIFFLSFCNVRPISPNRNNIYTIRNTG